MGWRKKDVHPSGVVIFQNVKEQENRQEKNLRNLRFAQKMNILAGGFLHCSEDSDGKFRRDDGTKN